MTRTRNLFHHSKATLLLLSLAIVAALCFLWNNSSRMFQNNQKSRQLMQLQGGSGGRGQQQQQQRRRRSTSIEERDDAIHQLLRNTEKTPSQLHDQTREKSLVLYTLFAGRQPTLELQIPYVLELLNKSIIDEVHLWDLTCKQTAEQKDWFGNGSNDTQFLWDNVWPMDKRIYIVRPPQCSWKNYYQYYANLLRPDDVLLKVDDDIIFVDTSRVQGFVDTIRTHPQVYVWSASVINNGIVAGIHAKDGILPDTTVVDLNHELQRPLTEGCLYHNATAGLILHKHFLANPQRYYQPPPQQELRWIKGRVSINFVAWLGTNFPRTMSYLRTAGKNIDAGGGDEWVITELGTKYFGQKLIVYLPLVVSHASFGQQRIYEQVIPLYNNQSATTHRQLLKNQGKWNPPPEGFTFPTTSNV